MYSKEENKTIAELAYDDGDFKLLNAPEIFAIEGTNHCNIKCIMCPRGEPDLMRRKVGHISQNTLESILEKANYFSDICWLHWFGEPLMNPNVYEHIKLAKSKIPNIGISTNATLLNPQAQRLLIDSGLDTIMIAIDGVDKETYESVRKSQHFTFEKVVTNAEEFLALRAELGLLKPHVILSMIAMDITSGQLEKFRERWELCGANEVIFKPYTNWGGQNIDVFDNYQVKKLQNTLNHKRAHPCKFLWTSIVVSHNGDVVPCCYDYDTTMTMGNINEHSIDEIWNGDKYIQLRQAELEGRNSSVLCDNCSQAPGRLRKTTFNKAYENIKKIIYRMYRKLSLI